MRRVALLALLMLVACTKAAYPLGGGRVVPILVQSAHAQTAAGTTCVMTLGTVPANNDLIVAHLMSVTSTTNWATLATFTNEQSNTTVGAVSIQAKVASSEPNPATYTFTNTTSAALSCEIFDFSNVNTSTLAAAFDAQGGTVISAAGTAFNSPGRANALAGDYGLFLLDAIGATVTFSAVNNTQLTTGGCGSTVDLINTASPSQAAYTCPVFPGQAHNNVLAATSSASTTGYAWILLLAGGNINGGVGQVSQVPLTGAGSIGPGVPSGGNVAAPLLHFPVWKYSSCAASTSALKAYNLDQSFAGATAKNANFIESTQTATQNGAQCTPSNATACAVSQTPLAGNEPCTPIVYMSPTNAGLGSGCNNHSFITNFGTVDADFYHFQTPLTNANFATNPPYCTSTSAQIIIPDTADYWSWLGSANSDNPFVGAPSNQGYFKDDSYLTLLPFSAVCSTTLGEFISQGTIAEISTNAQAEQHMANFVNHFASTPFYSNDIGGSGLGCSGVPQADLTLFNLQNQANDRGAISEQCLNDNNPSGTNKEEGCVIAINTCSQLLSSFPERCIFLNNGQPNAGGALGLRRTHLALLWIMESAEAGIGPSSWYKVVSWFDPDGGSTNNASEVYPENEIWPDPRTLVLPTGQTTMRKFVYGGTGVGSGCGAGANLDVGGIADTLENNGANSCGTGSNSKPAGAYSAYYGTCYYQGNAATIGHCAVVWNMTTSSITVQTAACTAGNACISWMPFTFTNQLQMNVGASTVGELKNAIGGTLACTDCDGTMQNVAVAFPFTLAAGDALILVQNTFGPI